MLNFVCGLFIDAKTAQPIFAKFVKHMSTYSGKKIVLTPKIFMAQRTLK